MENNQLEVIILNRIEHKKTIIGAKIFEPITIRNKHFLKSKRASNNFLSVHAVNIFLVGFSLLLSFGVREIENHSCFLSRKKGHFSADLTPFTGNSEMILNK